MVCRSKITKFIMPKTHLMVVEATCRYSGSKIVYWDEFSLSLTILITLLVKIFFLM